MTKIDLLNNLTNVTPVTMPSKSTLTVLDEDGSLDFSKTKLVINKAIETNTLPADIKPMPSLIESKASVVVPGTTKEQIEYYFCSMVCYNLAPAYNTWFKEKQAEYKTTQISDILGQEDNYWQKARIELSNYNKDAQYVYSIIALMVSRKKSSDTKMIYGLSAEEEAEYDLSVMSLNQHNLDVIQFESTDAFKEHNVWERRKYVYDTLKQRESKKGVIYRIVTASNVICTNAESLLEAKEVKTLKSKGPSYVKAYKKTLMVDRRKSLLEVYRKDKTAFLKSSTYLKILDVQL